ncbi:MAG: transposase [Chloracidobacterium sp.]|nr:transposase [Chloracidobacterium sp.]
MANTYSQVYLHLVFSTKNRTDLIHREIEERVWAYIAGVARHHGITPIQIGGIENHIHALLSVPTTLSPSQVAKQLGRFLVRFAVNLKECRILDGKMVMGCFRFQDRRCRMWSITLCGSGIIIRHEVLKKNMFDYWRITV